MKLLVGALIVITFTLVAFTFFAPVIHTSSTVGARPYCQQGTGVFSNLGCSSVVINVGEHHYDSVSMAVFDFGAASAGIFGSGFYYSIYS